MKRLSAKNDTSTATTNANITSGSITGITDLAVADGGTGASSAATALSNLGGIGAATTDTLTNKTATATSNTIGTATLSNPYKFYVYLSSNPGSSNTPTRVPMNASIYDTGSNVDISTNKGRFTAPIAGFYWFAAATGNTAASATQMQMQLYKNGSQILSGQLFTPPNAANILVVSGMLQLAANDYVEPFFTGGAGSVMYTGAPLSYFQGKLDSRL